MSHGNSKIYPDVDFHLELGTLFVSDAHGHACCCKVIKLFY